MSASFGTSKYGRSYKNNPNYKVDLEVDPDDVSVAKNPKSKSNAKSNSRTLNLVLDRIVYNSLGDAIKSKFKYPLRNEQPLLIGAKEIIKVDKKYYIKGKYILCSSNNKCKISNTNHIESVESQPKSLIIEILTNIKDLDTETDISNDLWNSVTQSLSFTSKTKNSYLKYEVNDQVLLRPGPQSYNKQNKPINYSPVTATITHTMPHSTIGDLSPEYEVTTTDETIHGGQVHEAYLRPAKWRACEGDEFDTSIFGILEYETLRAMDLRYFNYLSESGLSLDSIPYLDIESAFYNNKNDYYLTYPSIINDKKSLLTLFNIKIKSLINITLNNIKPESNNIIKNKNINTQNELLKHGKSIECIELQVAINCLINNINNDNKNLNSINDNNNINNNNENNESKVNEINNDIVQVSNGYIWLVFSSLNDLKVICDIDETILSKYLKHGTCISIQCDSEHPMQFQWNRKNKIFCLNNFYFKTQVALNATQ